MNYQSHEYADLFPMMLEDDYKSLSASIQNCGFDKTQPIILFEGKILDGRNRYKVCQENNINPVFEAFVGKKEEALQYVINRNLARRQLTSQQRAAIAVDAEELFNAFKEQAKEKQLRTKENREKAILVPQLIGERKTELKHKNESTEKVAKAYNTNREAVRKQQKVKKYAPELHEKVKAGEVKQEEAYKVAQKIEKEEKQIQKEIEQEAPAIQQAIETKPVEEKKETEQDSLFELSAPEPVKQGNETFTDNKGRVLHIVHSDNKQSKFNETNESIDWAWWSWNPITGCNHGCDYCYARDIATGKKMESIYPFGFEPTFLPHRLLAPKNTKPFSKEAIAKKATERNLPLDYAEQFAKNVFVCSMADLFGDWVPIEWIEKVFEQVTTHTQWNYLFLTKYPQRLQEIQDKVLGGKFPDNCWVGTTVDEQKRVRIAQHAFENIKASVKWLSLEPLLSALKFDNLGMFDMVAIGGQSASTQPNKNDPENPLKIPSKQPEWEWVESLIVQANLSGTMVYFKENLTVRPKKLPLSKKD